MMTSKTLFLNRNFSLNYLTIFFLLLVAFVPSRNSFALPALFQDELVKSGLNQPTSMAFLPDGRILVTQKAGQVFILDPRSISPSLDPYMTITDVDTAGERGLLDIVLDPAFPVQPYIYVAYQRTSDKRIFISRFTHQGDTADIGSEFIVWKDPDIYTHPFHHGGGLSFGPDGHLYLTTGEHFSGPIAQDLSKAGGKIIRVARDGTIPADNPYVGPNGILDEIWASGLRNPFRARWDIPTSGLIGPRLFIGEVGGNLGSSNEDIHIGKKGANFGWPFCEGDICQNSNQDYDLPLFSYEHLGRSAAVVGGIVYRGSQFPAFYSGSYFYGDYTRGFIRYLTFDTNGDVSSENAFLDNAGLVVDIKEGRDGALYYLEIASNVSFLVNSGALNRVIYNDGNQAPQITSAVANVTNGDTPFAVQFSGSATDAENDPLEYFWLFGDGEQAEGANVSHTYTTNGSYQATFHASDGNKTTASNPPITIIAGSKPEVTNLSPLNGSTFRAGETINFSAFATDDGVLTENSYKWTVLFVHNDHTHPEQGPIVGSSGTLHTPNSGHSFFDDTGFEISVQVTDQDGVSTTEFVRTFPEKVDITFNSQPSGISFFIDGTTITSPIVYDTAIGFIHNITAPQTTCLNDDQKYEFVSWSNGGSGSHNYTVPDQNEILTAIYAADGVCDANTNLPPLAFADEITMSSNATRIINVLENDTDSGGELAQDTVAIAREPQHGQVTVDNVTGSIAYSHDGSVMTSDSFTYTVEDDQGAVSNEATVLITILAGSCGKGIEQDGFNDWVNIPDLTLANDFTIEGWVKLVPGIDNKDALFGQEGGGPDLNFYAGKARLFVFGDKVIANTALTPDTWEHIAITRSGTNLTLYMNGIEDATGNWNGSLSLKAIGRGNGGFLQGMLDEVRVWNIARTATEISTSYHTSVDSNAPGLIGYWTFNGTDQVISDASNAANHGSLGINTTAGADDPVRLDSTAPLTENCDGGNTGGNTNVAPVAVNDTATVPNGESISITVLSNDSDSDGSLDVGSLTLVNQASNGTVDINVTGEMTYTHDGSVMTSDSFTYTVEDDQGAVSNEATVSITINNTVASCGKGIEQDGFNDWVNIPDLTLANDFTIEGWVKLAPGIDNKDALFGQEGGGPDLNFYAGKARLFVFGDKVIANTALTPDTWEHIAITRSGTNLTLYMNGIEDATGNWNGSLSLKAIGRGNGGFLQGMLDEVRVWNIARTATEISTSYHTSVDSNAPGLIGYWTFNGTDQVISDTSNAANHGSLGINTTAGADDPVRLDSTAPLTENCDGGNTGGNTNVAPVAVNDTATVPNGESISITVLSNDSDSDGSLDVGSLTLVNQASNGTVDINVTGEMTYTHDGSVMTSDSFTYTVEDDQGAVSNEATVSITINNTVASCGKGIEQDGFNDWVNIPDLTLANDFTIEGWVKLAPGIDNKDALFGQEGGGPDLNFYAGKARLFVFGDKVIANTALTPDTWEHIAITRSGTNLTLYMNGIEDATGNWNGSLSLKAIGRGNGGFLQGMLDEVRVWNIARTATEISTSYHTSVDSNAPGLIGYWTFNGTDQVISDASNAANHGSLGINTTAGADDPVRLNSTAPLTENCDGGNTGGNTNVAPVAVNDTATVPNGESISITVLSNDSDSDGSLDVGSLTLVNQASNGTVDINVTGEMTYTHDGSVMTSDSFTYTVEDDQGAVSNEATVSITINNTVASCGKGIEQDGFNDWVNIPDLTLANDFTIEGWVKLAPGIDNKDALFGQEGGGPDLNFYAGKARLFVFGDKVIANTALTPDTWEHIAITRSGTNLTLYMNGIEDATGNWNGSLSLKAIGRGNGGFLQGMLDEVRVWNIARTATEISTSYHTSVDSNAPGLIGYWTFNGTDQVISDTSNAVNHGSLGINTTAGADDPVRLNSTAPLTENCDGGNTGGNTNVAPVAVNDTATVPNGESISITVLSNDSDSDGSLDVGSLTLVNQASNGTVDINVTGEMTYTHDGSVMTSDSFTYTVEDDQGAVSNEATVSITINNTVASCGKGIEQDGFNDWVNIPDLTLANDFTIEGWVKLAPGIDNKDALFGQEGGGPDLNFYAGKARLFVFGDKVIANTALTPDTWEHIAITRSGTNLTLYMNGIEDATGNWNGSLSLKAIGRGNGGFLQGMLDEVRVWNIARTATEISTSYHTSVDSNAPGLIGYWTFNGTDQVISDASNAANHGSLGINTTAGADDPVRLDLVDPPAEICDEGNT